VDAVPEAQRRVWVALSELFLDTDTADLLPGIAAELAASPYSEAELWEMLARAAADPAPQVSPPPPDVCRATRVGRSCPPRPRAPRDDDLDAIGLIRHEGGALGLPFVVFTPPNRAMRRIRPRGPGRADEPPLEKTMLRKTAALALLLALAGNARADDHVMMQGFYWDNDHGWYAKLGTQLDELQAAGITAIWLPSPVKCGAGASSNGYDPYARSSPRERSPGGSRR
jgi:hypothetical protein